MRLLKAAKYFDRDSVYDGYTGDYLFKAQFSSYDASQMDGSFQRRRIMSVAPEILMPVRRSVNVHDELWLSGDLMVDGFHDAPIRRNTPCMLVTDAFAFLTPAQAALRGAGAASILHAHTKYRSDATEGARSSDTDPSFEIYFASTEVIPDGYFVRSEKALYHIKSVHSVPEGFNVAMSDQVARNIGPEWEGDELWDRTAEVDVQFSGVFDPITEESLPGITTTGIMMDIARLFRLGSPSSPAVGNGDRALVVAKSAVPQVDNGSKIVVNTIEWRIYSVQPYEDAWLLLLKRT